jgi:hypothetical protein
VRVAMQVEESRAGTGGQRGENALVAALAHVDDALEVARARSHGGQRASTGSGVGPGAWGEGKRKKKEEKEEEGRGLVGTGR